MTTTHKKSGRCLCGAVHFTVEKAPENINVCHCEMCRRWSSGPFFALHGEGPVTFEGDEYIERYKSSEWAERGFCRVCGTSLFYRIVESDQYIVSVGALDDQAGFVLDSEIFIDEKPPFYAFANKTAKMTGPEVFALFAPPDGDDTPEYGLRPAACRL